MGSFHNEGTVTGEGIFAMKLNGVASRPLAGCALDGAEGGGRDWEGFEGDGMGVFPTAIRLLERVAFGGMLR